jgi:hypothetical protein
MRVIIGLLRRSAQFDIAVLDLGKDQADGGKAVFFASLHCGDLGGFNGVTNHFCFPNF